ncbi:AMP-binding protein [Sphingobium phenoxybenzoativorans]|jgi:acyl-CoA synthetase (AMP-forming)/AMP-acid ligase II|nr:AMP-binding protein [Sphingobium phenoxybenzoativorans]
MSIAQDRGANTRAEPRSVYDLFVTAARISGGCSFLCVPKCSERSYLPDGAEYSYSFAMTEVTKIATSLREAGYGPGHRVALVLGNRPEYFWHFLALNSLGACAVPLNPDYLAHEFSYALRQADVCLVIVAGESTCTVRAANTGCSSPIPLIDLDEEGGQFPPAPPCGPDEAFVSDRIALIIYTSGTTSRPKGCLISNWSCLEAGRSYVGIGGLLTLAPERERLYVPLPTFHMNATVLAFNAMLLQRGCLISTDRFRASTWWQEVRDSQATGVHYLGLIPPVLLKAPPSASEGAPTVKFGLGAGVDPSLHEAFEKRFGFPLVEVWGMTETSRIIANAHEPRYLDTRAFGRPVAPWEVLVADEYGNPANVDEAGEMLVRCAGSDPRDGFFSGYVNDDEATELAWAGGWFHTGDIVRRGPDGMLYFVERRKNIIRRSGENIAAAEVEEAIIDHPSVAGVVVLAVADDLRGEEVLACVIAAPGVPADENTADIIIEICRGRLASHKLPGWIQFISQIPLTATQKVRKDELLVNFNPEAVNVHDKRHLKSKRKSNAIRAVLR